MNHIFKALIENSHEHGNLKKVLCDATKMMYPFRFTLIDAIKQIEDYVKQDYSESPRLVLDNCQTGIDISRAERKAEGGKGITKVWDKSKGILINGSYYDTIWYDLTNLERSNLWEADTGGFTLHACVAENSDKTLCHIPVLDTKGPYPSLNYILKFEHDFLKYCDICHYFAFEG